MISPLDFLKWQIIRKTKLVLKYALYGIIPIFAGHKNLIFSLIYRLIPYLSSNYLAMEKAVPFVAPKVEQATPKGTIHAKDPKTRDPKVIATAFEFSISDPVMTGQSGYIIRILYPGYIFILCD